jgi:hypothetical protein
MAYYAQREGDGGDEFRQVLALTLTSISVKIIILLLKPT